MHEIDFELAKTLKQKIFPLLEEAHSKKGNIFDRMLVEQKKGTEIRLNNSERLLKILHKVDRSKLTTEEITAITLHLEFLILFEGFFATQINFLIFTLIANGHDFYSTRKGKYVRSFDEIEETDFSFRMKFLKEHNFIELFNNEREIRKLRNSVAHAFYEIESNGDIKIDNEKVSSENYAKYYDYLRNIAFAVYDIRNVYYLRLITSLSPTEKEKIMSTKLEEVLCSCGYVNLLPEFRNFLEEQFTCTKCGKTIS
jgi:hypothetical protein